jgi:hypothetical protein
MNQLTQRSLVSLTTWTLLSNPWISVHCILYNGESSQVSIMCKNVRDEFHKLYDGLFIDFYL